MAFKDDFYTKENIIGFTGDLHNNPTVYFKTDDHVGRITQEHFREINIGRHDLYSTNGYRSGNFSVDQIAEMYGETREQTIASFGGEDHDRFVEFFHQIME